MFENQSQRSRIKQYLIAPCLVEIGNVAKQVAFELNFFIAKNFKRTRNFPSLEDFSLEIEKVSTLDWDSLREIRTEMDKQRKYFRTQGENVATLVKVIVGLQAENDFATLFGVSKSQAFETYGVEEGTLLGLDDEELLQKNLKIALCDDLCGKWADNSAWCTMLRSIGVVKSFRTFQELDQLYDKLISELRQ